MTGAAWLLLVAAGGFAVADWFAVGTRNKPLEYVAKPTVLLALIAVAFTLQAQVEAQQAWFVGALALCMAGDVFLMLPRDRFVAGLASFLLAHLAYVAGFVAGGLSAASLGAGTAVALGVGLLLGRRILAGVDTAALQAAVGAYMLTVGATLAAAFGSGKPLAVAGAGLFLASDALIGWRRFVSDRPWMPVTIHVAYHLGQAGLVLSLLG